MRAHIVKDGLIVNTIEVESLGAFPELSLVDAEGSGGGIGDSWDGKQIVPQKLEIATMPEESSEALKLEQAAKARGYTSFAELVAKEYLSTATEAVVK